MTGFDKSPRQLSNLSAGQTALVTGGGRGVGRAIALALAEAGARVAVAARSRDEIEETAALARERGTQALAIPLDVTDERAVQAAVGQALVAFGQIDLLVNNAGIAGPVGPAWELPAADWWQVVEVNLHGAFLCGRAVLPGMITRRRGRIINLASNLGLQPAGDASAYSVSQAALLRLTDCLAQMAQPHNVQVFAISPGAVRTAMSAAMPKLAELPEENFLPAERAGWLCAYLASGKADRLSGRYFHVLDDIQELALQADEIIANDLYTLRLRE